MNRLALVLAAAVSSLAFACAASTTDDADVPQPATEESNSTEAVTHSAPAKVQGPAERQQFVVEPAEEEGAFVVRRLARALPTPTPKPMR